MGRPLSPGPLSLVLYPTKWKINSTIVQEERNGARAWQDGRTAKGGAVILVEAQGGGGSVWIVNRSTVLVRWPGQVEVPAELREDVSAHGFWKRGTTVMFDIRIVNLNAGSYLRMMPEKALTKVEKENKDLCLQSCLERRHTFTLMVYSADGIP